MGMIKRIKARRAAKNPRQQYYGGSEEALNATREVYGQGRRAGEARLDEGLSQLDSERQKAGVINQGLSQDASNDRWRGMNQADIANRGVTKSLDNYDATRAGQFKSADAIDANAGQLEGYAKNAANEYTSAADAAFKASTERNQRNALGLAAGRGNSAIRMALAGSQAANAGAAVDQQVTRAQEANQLNAMRNDAIANAAGIRGTAAGVRQNVGAMDQQAAGLQNAREQAFVQSGQQALGQRAAITAADAALGAQTAGARIDAGTGGRDAYLGAQQNMETAQLGQNMSYEQQRLANAKTKGPGAKLGSVIFDPMNFRGSEAGGLGSVY